jgi:hypothetical protein
MIYLDHNATTPVLPEVGESDLAKEFWLPANGVVCRDSSPADYPRSDLLLQIAP